jgi:cell division protein FtsI/penicillin-binding protein 2
MAYEEGAVRPTDEFDCNLGAYTFRDGRRRRTLHDYHPYGKLSAEKVLVKSSNIGITKIALLMSDATLKAYLKRFGVGIVTGIELRGEAEGWFAPKGWSFYSRTSIPWGQEVSMTPLQILAAINTIANGGIWVRPTIFLRATGRDGSIEVPITEPVGERILSEETASLVRRAMVRVVKEGTGRNARMEGYEIGGKTGTKCKRKKDGTYDEDRSVTSFVCFAPASRPRLTLIVSLDEPRQGATPHKLTGGKCAAPVAKNILERAFKILGISPESGDGRDE